MCVREIFIPPRTVNFARRSRVKERKRSGELSGWWTLGRRLNFKVAGEREGEGQIDRINFIGPVYTRAGAEKLRVARRAKGEERILILCIKVSIQFMAECCARARVYV